MKSVKTRSITQRKQRSITLLSSLTIAIPCSCYMILGDAPAITAIAAIGLLISIGISRPIVYTTRSIVYAGTLSVLLAVIANEVYPVDGDRFFSPIPTEVLFPFVIAVGVSATYFIQQPITIRIILISSLLSMILQGTIITDPVNIRFEVDSEFWRNRYFVFVTFFALQMVIFILLIPYSLETHVYKKNQIGSSPPFSKRLIFVGSIGAVVGLTTLLCIVAVKTEHMLEPVFDRVLRVYLGSFQSDVVFGDEVNLFRKLDRHVRSNQDNVVLRVDSPIPPKYLRGRVYDHYENGRWLNRDSTRRQPLMKATTTSRLASNRFYRRNYKALKLAQDAGSKIVIYPAERVVGDTLLAIGTTRIVDIIAETVESDRSGTLFPKGWDRDSAYSLTNDTRLNWAFNRRSLDSQLLDETVQFSDQVLEANLDRISDYIFGSEDENTIDKINRLYDYFQKEFTYTLRFNDEYKNRDPVLQFLEKSKSGHCELFASSTALLLRTQNIPTRYVTGFMCTEPHPMAGYWISRLGDCHAWVEAWIAERGEWTIVETTPAIGLSTDKHRMNAADHFVEIVTVHWNRIYNDIKHGYFAEATISVLASLWALLRWIFWTSWRKFIWTIAVIVIVVFWIKSKRTRPRLNMLDDRYDLRMIFTRLERHLHRFGIRRTQAMTIGDIIALIKEKNIPYCDETIKVLNAYEHTRYCPSPPQRDEISVLNDKVTEHIRRV